jgi:hypothetical protein
MRQRQPRTHDPGHLAFVRALPCVVCGNNIETEAAHIRFGDISAAKRFVGKGEKPDDKWTLPLCGTHHAEQHKIGEDEFWRKYGIDPLKVAAFLAINSGDFESGEMIVLNVRAT